MSLYGRRTTPTPAPRAQDDEVAASSARAEERAARLAALTIRETTRRFIRALPPRWTEASSPDHVCSPGRWRGQRSCRAARRWGRYGTTRRAGAHRVRYGRRYAGALRRGCAMAAATGNRQGRGWTSDTFGGDVRPLCRRQLAGSCPCCADTETIFPP